MCMSKWSQAWTLRTWPPPFVPIRCFSATRRWSLPVDSVAALEQEGRGIVLERRSGPAGGGASAAVHRSASDEAMMTARIMAWRLRGIAEVESRRPCASRHAAERLGGPSESGRGTAWL